MPNFSAPHKTTCCYCGVGCGIHATLDFQNRLAVEGDPDHPTNRGMLCSKGRYLNHVAMNRTKRLLHPEMRACRAHPRERVSWDTALERTARVFKSIIERHGPDSVGLYVSGQLLTEEYYIANKLMKGFIGSNNIDTNSRLCMSSTVVGYKKALGDDLVPIAYADIEQSDCILIAGANPAWCHPILFRRIEQHREQSDLKIIVIDPRATDTTALADVHLQLKPGTDIVLYNALARCLIESGKIDFDYIDAHVDDFEVLREHVLGTSIDDAAKFCAVGLDEIKLAAQYIGNAEGFLSMWAMGLNQSSEGVNKNLALMNLSLITGQIGKPGAGPFSLTGQANAMGGREVGGLSTALAAHRDLADPEERAFVSDFWGGTEISATPGCTATEMFEGLESGKLKAVWIICTNPAVSMPNLNRVTKALESARFVVVQDISNQSDTLRYADVVLPAAGWLEKSGTMTNSERRVNFLPKMLDAPGEALPDAEILCQFAAKMGWGNSFEYADSSEIFDEHVALTKGTAIDQSGLSHERLRGEGSMQWPCPSDRHPGTQRLFEDGVYRTDSGKAQLHAVDSQYSTEAASEEYPFILTTGRVRDQWHTMTKTGDVSRLRRHLPRPFMEIHPADAETLNLIDGDSATVNNGHGEVRIKVAVTSAIKQGVVFIPMHWGRALEGKYAPVNNLTSSRVDPVSKEPEFKYTAVSIVPTNSKKRTIAVIGTGAAGLEFTSQYLKLNSDDTLHVFGEEPDIFYNRILLPEYISEQRPWDDLQSPIDELKKNPRVHLHVGTRVARIDRDAKQVVDENGERFDYDRAVLATGSRARVPHDFPKGLKGSYTLRSRGDAERLKVQAKGASSAVILGGGLLGVEIADALNFMGLNCTLIHRSSHLLRTMLDSTGSRMVQHALDARGIDCLMQDGIVKVMGDDAVTGVRTLSGAYLPCDLLVAAVGIEPNVELAQDAGLTVRRAALVNRVMQTSDSSIYAIGEVAEHENIVYGTSLAAQEQAQIAAIRISGKQSKMYTGTVSLSILKIHGFNVSSIGIITKQGDDWEEAIALDETIGYYKKCLIHEGRLKGAILIGAQTELPQFKQWIVEGLELDDERRHLITSTDSAKTPLPLGNVVCTCMNVGDEDLKSCIADGATTFESLCDASKAGAGCGSCRPAMMRFLSESMAPKTKDAASKVPGR